MSRGSPASLPSRSRLLNNYRLEIILRSEAQLIGFLLSVDALAELPAGGGYGLDGYGASVNTGKEWALIGLAPFRRRTRIC